MFKKFLNSSLARSAGIYTMTYGINSAIPFLLLPILTRYLTTTDYGIVAMFGLMVNFIYPFTSLSVTTAVPRMYCERDRIDIQAYVTNFLFVLLCSTALVSMVLYLVSGPISDLAQFPAQLLWVVVAVAFGQSLTMLVLTLFQVQLKPLQYAVFQILLTSLNAGLSIWFVTGLGMNWQGRVGGQFIAYIFIVAAGIIILFKNRWLKFRLDASYIKHALVFSLPLIPHALGGLVITMTDRVFITRLVGLDATGIYTAGFQIAMIINLFGDAFHKAWVPWLYERLKTEILEQRIRIVKLNYLFFLSILASALALGFLAPPFMKYFLGKDFSGSGVYVLWVALGFAFQGMYMCVVSFVFYAQSTSKLAMITFTLACANIPLNYIAIKSFGAIGAAYSNTFIHLCKFILVWILAARVYPMPWNLRTGNGAKNIVP